MVRDQSGRETEPDFFNTEICKLYVSVFHKSCQIRCWLPGTEKYHVLTLKSFHIDAT
jgi:hypothetical protein